ncbi:MAG: threonine/serine dehydratase [Pseudomonadota bacterium]
MSAVAIADIHAAAERMRGVAIETPLIRHPALDAAIGGSAFVKCETHQPVGSFKLRGAYNKIAAADPAIRSGGVIAYSSGNHAQGVAYAAARFGVGATIVMPADAPKMKIARTRRFGGTVVFYDRAGGEQREPIGEAILAEQGGLLVRPYDDPHVIAGQGVCGLEIARQTAAVGQTLDLLLVCCGGGGLTAGCAIAMAAESPDTAVYAVEPETHDDTARSLAAGERVANAADAPPSICDAIMTPTPGALTFAINRKLLAGALRVTDDEVRAAMAFAFRELKTVVEPGGAVALAAALSGKVDTAGKTIGVVLSGGNVDADVYAAALAA